MTRTGELISQHVTSEGIVVWSRCSCGRLTMSLVPHTPDGRPLTAGRHCPGCARA